jgi:hypothetical protein
VTSRVCIVGNSHVAALKRGWREMESANPAFQVDMFGAFGSHFPEIVVANGELRAGSVEGVASFVATGGREYAVLRNYDLIVVVGGGVRLFSMANLLTEYCPPFLNAELATRASRDPEFRKALIRFYKKEAPRLVSDGLLREIMTARAARSPAAALIRNIAAAASAPVLHLPAPFPSSELLTRKPKHVISRLVELGYGPLFAELVWTSLRAALGNAAMVIEPPDHLLVEGVLTEKTYSVGGARLDDEIGDHSDEDFLHMNGAYGAVLMGEILKCARPSAAADTV